VLNTLNTNFYGIQGAMRVAALLATSPYCYVVDGSGRARAGKERGESTSTAARQSRKSNGGAVMAPYSGYSATRMWLYMTTVIMHTRRGRGRGGEGDRKPHGTKLRAQRPMAGGNHAAMRGGGCNGSEPH
jgi:hypothetical protein